MNPSIQQFGCVQPRKNKKYRKVEPSYLHFIFSWFVPANLNAILSTFYLRIPTKPLERVSVASYACEIRMIIIFGTICKTVLFISFISLYGEKAVELNHPGALPSVRFSRPSLTCNESGIKFQSC